MMTAEEIVEFISNVLGDETKERNLSALSRETELTRQTLINIREKKHMPKIDVVCSVMQALGYELVIRPRPVVPVEVLEAIH